MNLTTDAWIPIVWFEGRPGVVSLCEAFERGEEIRDLAVRPHERIAVMRLLICIGQAALSGPADYDEWKACLPRIVPSALDYLNRWRQAFELFGNGQRFLKVANLRNATTTPFSPRAWGWSGDGAADRYAAEVLPTCVGMVRWL